MTKKLVAVLAASAALLLVASSFEPAEARHGHGSGGWSGGGKSHFAGARLGGKSFVAKSFHFGHARHFRGRHRFIGAPLVYGAYYYGPYYGNGCYWLKRKAIVTGSPYWWDRYNECLYGYDY
jgi:hypothetical protein